MQDVAVFFAQGASAAEGGEAEVEELGEGLGLERILVQSAGAVDVAEDGGDLVIEDALVVGVLLVCTDCLEVRGGVGCCGAGKGGWVLMSGAAAKG